MVTVTTDLCQRMINDSMRETNAENLEKFQALETSATAKLLEIDNKMTSVFKELDQKLVFINDQNATILKQQDVIKNIVDAQEKSHVVADEKLTRFAALGETLNETNKALHSQDQVIRAFMVGKEQELKGQFEECNKQLIGVLDRARVEFGATTTQQGGWQQGHSDRPTRGFIDIKDQKIDKMPESMSKEMIRK